MTSFVFVWLTHTAHRPSCSPSRVKPHTLSGIMVSCCTIEYFTCQLVKLVGPLLFFREDYKLWQSYMLMVVNALETQLWSNSRGGHSHTPHTRPTRPIDSFRFDSFRFDSVRFGSIRFVSSFRFDSIVSVRLGSIRFDSIRLGSSRFDSFRFDSFRFDSFWFDSLPPTNQQTKRAFRL